MSWPLAGVRRSKMPWFSVKNGRLSVNTVSIAEKSTTSSSLSTWPKSGLKVAASRRFCDGFQVMSAPALNCVSSFTRSARAVAYGTKSKVAPDSYCEIVRRRKSERNTSESLLMPGHA